ncbi:hypothetical protein CC1G_10205 [Coprinopsis cinerea okayama7|uniref:Uncharacterized protein n=1 Tax=Coprinopsis cinerea (strain Okayama-7 / 130 / ATCC MYA-4618 / FGSC 9003) TaxID=240176 RepID=A8PGF9_COPC7|nr:hypothetical protein CC1G_10205 [Coprinopsis cinerea okayama7\|eukprot:XP_001841208.1 hypothetical protein CC1G_10205 [Coprinopsis cinerea okayama7\
MIYSLKQSTFLSIFALLLTLTAQVAAVDVWAFRSEQTCAGVGVIWYNPPSGVCLAHYDTTVYGWSLAFDGLPNGSSARGYKNGGCTTDWALSYGPGDVCMPAWGQTYSGAMWVAGNGRVVSGPGGNVTEVQEGGRTIYINNDEDGGDVVGGSCETSAFPDAFAYEDADGVRRTVKLPKVENATAVAFGHYDAKRWDVLAGYEAVESA